MPERLHSRGAYVQVQTSGRKFRGQKLLLMVATSPATSMPVAARMGYTVSRKVGNAVVRNRIRRVLKEAVRMDAHRLCCGLDHVLIAHPKAAATPPAELRQELLCLLDRARAWAQPTP